MTNYDTNQKVKSKLMRRFSCFDGVGNDLREARSYLEALSLGDLDYEVTKMPIYLGDGTEIKDHFCTITNNGNQLGVVGKDYTVINNKEAFSFADIIVQEGRGIYETGGASKGSKNIIDYAKTFMVVRHADIEILGDAFNSFTVFQNSFDGSSGIRMQFINLRLICLNGLTRKMKGQENIQKINIQHSQTAEQKIKIAHETLDKQHQYVEALKREAEKLANTPFSKKEFQKEIIPLILKEMKLTKDFEEDQNARQRGAENIDLTIKRLVSAYEADDIQNFNNTAYKVLLTLSDFESHANPLRNTDNPNIYFNRVLSGMLLTNAAVDYIIKSRGIVVK